MPAFPSANANCADGQTNLVTQSNRSGVVLILHPSQNFFHPKKLEGCAQYMETSTSASKSPKMAEPPPRVHHYYNSPLWVHG